MIDRETWGCANQLLRQHGGNALSLASRRAAELLAEGTATATKPSCASSSGFASSSA
ncbi:hypothetical protein [Sphingomonas sp. S2-65]|uniref:hypothetical protein n=1 Tax=Sphingomonas sp. S2-65 TaxID=2903960 RepID=UPI001F300BCF|nr:hypothetical protein [Sphingomonas sp. S2-65]UYY58020.1 hypothetical protein LZ586_15350 [Sphingomonas sp. S2-65]